MQAKFTFAEIRRIRVVGPGEIGFASGTYHEGVTMELLDDGHTLRIAPIEKEES